MRFVSIAVLAALTVVLSPSPACACDASAPRQAVDTSPRSAADACPALGTPSPFGRRPENPIIPYTVSHCYSIARDQVGWLRFENDRLRGMLRRTSPNGLSWSDSALVLPNTGPAAYYSGFFCPDALFSEGLLHLFLDVFIKPEYADDPRYQGSFGYAFSADRGASWVVHPFPVIIYTRSGALIEDWAGTRMQTVVDTGNDGPRRYVMAYSHNPGGAYSDELHGHGPLWVAFSPDMLTWHLARNGPSIRPGDDGWNDGYVTRSRLFLEEDGTLHIFYSALSGTEPGRCIRFGHAVSYDRGLTWTPFTAGPVLDVAGDGRWDDDGLIVPEVVALPSGNRVRIYYGAYDGGHFFGAAEAFLPFDPMGDPPTTFVMPGPGATGLPLRPAVPAAQLMPAPNPFRSTTRLDLALDPGTSRRGAAAAVRVHDVAGRHVRTLWEGAAADVPRTLEWDGTTDDGALAAAGRYVIEVRIDGARVEAAMVTRLE